ncbi:MAG TPA: hypothetical protein VGN20_19255 [Mucilaginibacter sp.]|jgi:hypothetical protein
MIQLKPLKLELSEKKRQDVVNSIKIIGVLAEMIKVEHQSELVDSTFKNAIVNQKAKRIKEDAIGIIRDLSTNQRVNIRFLDDNYIEDYACELHRVFTFFVGLPLDQVKEAMDNLITAKISIEAESNNSPSDLWQVVHDTIVGGLQGAELENKTQEQGIAYATDAICELVKHSVTDI